MTDKPLVEIWVYLSTLPLFGLTATLVAYLLAYRIYQAVGGNPLLNPVAVAVALLIALLQLTGIDYQAYFEGAKFVHFILGPATVALAVPLYQQLGKLRRIWLPVLISVMMGVSVASLSAIVVARWLGGSDEVLLSLAPKSVTAAVAMGISEKIGGLPSLTAVLVIATGIIGAIVGNRLFDVIGISDDSEKGIAMGVTSHGIGTARAFQLSPEMGAFSGLAMALSAFASALLLPFLIQLVGFDSG
jgi:predicted murein hydrolase (TIGR00659 family)